VAPQGLSSEKNGTSKDGASEKLITQLHFTTDQFTPTSYRMARIHDIAKLPQTRPINPMVSDSDIEMRSMG
jgi:hypothetical protein